MIYIESVKLFFEELGYVNSRLYSYIDERRDEYSIKAIMIKTPAIQHPVFGDTYIYSYMPTLSESKEADEENGETTLVGEELCLYSFDNEHYCHFNFLPTCNKELFETAFESPKGDYKFYVCDITGSFYTIVTPENKTAFDFYSSVYLTTYEEVGVFDDRVKMYYHNQPLNYYVFSKRYGILSDADELAPITFVDFYKEDGEVYCDEETIDIQEFVYDISTEMSKDDVTAAIRENIESAEKNYDENYSKIKNINIFGRALSFDYDKSKFAVSTMANAIDYLFNVNDDRTGTTENKDKIFDNLVKKSIEGGQFDLDAFTKNFVNACEDYYMYNSLAGMFISSALRLSKYTAIQHFFWKEYERTYFEKLVFGFDHMNDPGSLAEELPTLLYVQTHFDELQDVCGKVAQYQEDVENFGNSFHVNGGGFGLKGFVKGVMTASLINAATNMVYRAYKSSKLNADEMEKTVKEFMVSESSQDMFREMIRLDGMYLSLKKFNVMYHKIKNLECFCDGECLPDYGTIFDSFNKAYKLYSIALAKKLKLATIPRYDGLETYYDMDAVKLMEEALLLYPYDRHMYCKYLEFGGNMSEELMNYAGIHMVDLRQVYEEMKEEIERAKEEERKRREEEERLRAERERAAEQARIEAEKRRIEEEKRRAEYEEQMRIQAEQRRIEEEKRRAEYEEQMRIQAEQRRAEEERRRIEYEERMRREEEARAAAEAERLRVEEERRKAYEERVRKSAEEFGNTYGDDIASYPALFEIHKNSPVYIHSFGKEFANHNDIANAVFEYLNETYPGVNLTLYSGVSDKFASKKNNIKSVHGVNVADNNVLMFYDSTLFGSAKDGFVVTNEKICVRNAAEKPYYVPIKDMQTLSVAERGFYINNTFRVDASLLKLSKEEIVNIIAFCACNIIHLNKYKGTQPSAVAESTGVGVNDGVPVSDAEWTCVCGNKNPINNKFCGQCGSAKPVPADNPKCPSCGAVCSGGMKFCGECGTKLG